jgi:hypothetical protein
MTRPYRAFLLLVLAQAAHSVEEYVFRLDDVFAPARFLSGLLNDDRRRGFLLSGYLAYLTTSRRPAGRTERHRRPMTRLGFVLVVLTGATLLAQAPSAPIRIQAGWTLIGHVIGRFQREPLPHHDGIPGEQQNVLLELLPADQGRIVE